MINVKISYIYVSVSVITGVIIIFLRQRVMARLFRLIWAGFGTGRAALAVGSNVELGVRPPHMHACDFIRTIPMCVKCSMLRTLATEV